MIRFCVGEMPKRPKKQRRTYSWAVYREGQALIFVGFIDDAPDEKMATALAAEEYNFPPDELDRLVVRQLGEQCSAVRRLERLLAAETDHVKGFGVEVSPAQSQHLAAPHTGVKAETATMS